VTKNPTHTGPKRRNQPSTVERAAKKQIFIEKIVSFFAEILLFFKKQPKMLKFISRGELRDFSEKRGFFGHFFGHFGVIPIYSPNKPLNFLSFLVFAHDPAVLATPDSRCHVDLWIGTWFRGYLPVCPCDLQGEVVKLRAVLAPPQRTRSGRSVTKRRKARPLYFPRKNSARFLLSARAYPTEIFVRCAGKLHKMPEISSRSEDFEWFFWSL
jgi:hypothetical protein